MNNDDHNIKHIEDFLYKTYLQNYKSKIKILKINNNKNHIDYLKFEYLTWTLPFNLNNVEVRKSKVHGLGVFAKKKILKGELITFYPGDILEYSPDENRDKGDRHLACFTSKRFNNHYKDKKPDKKDRNNDYAYDINKKYTIIGCPCFKDDPNYVGHFINDGAKSSLSERSKEIYIKITILKSNCVFYNLKNLHIAIISTKNININDELFISYGPEYWDSYNKK